MVNNLFYIILGVAGLSLLIRLLFLLFVFVRSVRLKPGREAEFPSVSVVVAARNEYENLEKNLPSLLNQDYPDFEVVVVDDCSTDETRNLLTLMQNQHDKLRFSWVPDSQLQNRGKKMALTVGIKAASHDRLLFTDADCYPASDQWLKEMVSHMSPATDFVLGYGAYEERKGLLNYLIRFDTLRIAMRYAGYARAGKVYMGVGRNLSYTKQLWLGNRGFAGFYDIASGDDDLFVNAYAKSKRTSICFSENSKTLSAPKESYKQWVDQKSRHMKTAGYYPAWLRFLLSLEPVNHIFSILIVALCIIFFPAEWMSLLPLGLWVLIKTFEVLVTMKAAKNVGEKKMILPALFFDVLLPLNYIIFALAGARMSKKRLWK